MPEQGPPMKQTILRTAAIAALCSVGQAQAAEGAVPTSEPCITNAEVQGAVAYVLPILLRTVSDKCSALLPANAYLRTASPGLVRELEASQNRAWPQARALLIKFAREDKAMVALSDEALRPIVDQIVGKKLEIRVEVGMCGDVNDIAEAVAPLSPDQTVNLFATILNIAGRHDKKMRTCAPRLNE